MAFDNKPSMYSDRGAIGSPDELDAYGVWVKSEPQDLVAGLAEAAGFGGEAIPYETDFDSDFGGIESPDFDLSDLDNDPAEIGFEAFNVGNIDESISVNDLSEDTDQGNEEMSNRLLMKIADELSSIKSELSTLKKEFAEIKGEDISSIIDDEINGVDIKSASDYPDPRDQIHQNYFSEDDEKISLSGDEMSDILSSADFSDSDDIAFDPLRDEDEAALKKLSAENEHETKEEASEEIEIDFENLGIELEELHELRVEGASPETPAPDDPSFLEEDPFASSDTGFEPLDLNLDDASFNLNLDDFDTGIPVDNTDIPELEIDEPDISSILDAAEITEPPLEEPVLEDIPLELEDIKLDDISIDDSIIQLIPEALEASAGEAAVPFDEDLEVITGDDFTSVSDINAGAVIGQDENSGSDIPVSTEFKTELKSVLSYMDHLLEFLPEGKIEEFAKSDYFDTYKKLFKELGLV